MDTARYLAWFKRIWPLFAELGIVLLHAAVLAYFWECTAPINKVFGAGLQLSGAAMLVFSMNETIGTFRKHGIWGTLELLWADRPWKAQGLVAHAVGSASGSATLTGRVPIISSGGSIEARIANLEKQLDECRSLIVTNEHAANVRMDGIKAHLQATMEVDRAEVKGLRSSVERTLVDGVHFQIFGLFLAVHGTIAGYFG